MGESNDESCEVVQEYEQSAVSKRVQNLKQAALRAVKSRKRVPHTLFWSLLRAQVSEIKEEKEKERVKRSLL